MAIVVVAFLQPKSGHVQSVLDAFAAVSHSVHLEPGCELYAAHTDGEVVVVVERWSSREHLSAHSAGEPVRTLHGLLAEVTQATPDVRVLTEVPMGDPLKGSIQIPPACASRAFPTN